MTNFKDHFSGQAGAYAAHRPGYPAALFAHLYGLAPGDVAWDCATGSGQAARALAEHYPRVVATDASARQVENAAPHPRVTYRVAPAERSGLPDHGVDLLTVAQALHWLDLDRFYAEARRVVRPGGVVAAWCYGLFSVSPAVDAVVGRLYHEVLEGHWPAGREHVDNGYSDLPFPFDRLEAPPVTMTARWDLQQLLGMLSSWSAVARYDAAHRPGALELVAGELIAAWGDARRQVTWPLYVFIGRV